MAEPVSRIATARLMSCFMLAMLLVPVSTMAETLSDPTRPPGSLDGTMPPFSAGPALQSVLVSPRRTIAIISGKTVQVGDKFGDAVVVRITEREVILRSGRRMQTLKLFPGVEKRRIPAGPTRNLGQ